MTYLINKNLSSKGREPETMYSLLYCPKCNKIHANYLEEYDVEGLHKIDFKRQRLWSTGLDKTKTMFLVCPICKAKHFCGGTLNKSPEDCVCEIYTFLPLENTFTEEEIRFIKLFKIHRSSSFELQYIDLTTLTPRDLVLIKDVIHLHTSFSWYDYYTDDDSEW